MGIGFPELMIILVIIMIIFGAGKLPEIGSAFGNSIKNFKKSMKEAEELKESADVSNAVAEVTGVTEGENADADANSSDENQDSESQEKSPSPETQENKSWACLLIEKGNNTTPLIQLPCRFRIVLSTSNLFRRIDLWWIASNEGGYWFW